MALFIFTLFTAYSALANVYKLDHTSSRFNLKINTEKLTFESEQLKYEVQKKKCNADLITEFDSELFRALPRTSEKGGIPFHINHNQILVATKSSYAGQILSMNQRILRFQMEEKRACK